MKREAMASGAPIPDARRWVRWAQDSRGRSVRFLVHRRFPFPVFGFVLQAASSTPGAISEDCLRLLEYGSPCAKELRTVLHLAGALFVNRGAGHPQAPPEVRRVLSRIGRDGIQKLRQARRAFVAGREREARLLLELARHHRFAQEAAWLRPHAAHRLRQQARRSEAGRQAVRRRKRSGSAKFPESAQLLLELHRLMAGGRTERDARSVLRHKYGGTSQGLGQKLRIAGFKRAKAKVP